MSTLTLDDARSVLQDRWGYDDFRKGQVPVVEAALAGKDVLAVLPTGSGKSVCFQIPAILSGGCAIVVSPLIALMKDQCDQCAERDVKASFINSHCTEQEIEKRLFRMEVGKLDIMYVAPERLRSRMFRRALMRTKVSYIVVDEAHCHPVGTLIDTPSGSIPIEDLSPGDVVSSWDGNRVVNGTVQQVQVKRVGRRKLLRIATPDGGVTLTDDHPLFVKGRGYVAAREIHGGEELLVLRRPVPPECPANQNMQPGMQRGTSTEDAQKSNDVSGGVRRSESPCVRSAGAGQTEDGGAFWQRVGRVEVLEPGDHERDDESGRDNRVVVALTIAGFHNYFAGGVLNHNCASRWGHDFRPAYMRIKDMTRALTKRGQRPPVVAVTATATADIETDVVQAVGMDPDDYVRVIGDPIRPNLSYQCRFGYPWANIRTLSDQWDTDTGRYIVYVGTRNGSEKVAEQIEEVVGPKQVGVYHAGLTKADRTIIQEKFRAGTKPIIVATNAFGMGIDIPDIRAVVHFGIPGSLEDYTQEAGRAGRDGKPADVILLQDEYAEELHLGFWKRANPEYDYYEKVWEYLHEHPHGQLLKLTAKDMAGEVEEYAGLPEKSLDPSAIGGVLSTLDAYGLVKRTYAPSGILLRCRSCMWTGFDMEALTPRQVSIIEHVRELSPLMPEDDDTVDVGIDNPERTAVKFDLGLIALKRQLRAIEKKTEVWEVCPAFTGKTTEVIAYGENLDNVLPREVIEGKANRELARLNTMIFYSKLHTQAERVAFMRKYFMEGPA